MNALTGAAFHANVCNGARISDSVGEVSNVQLDLVDNKENMYAQQYVGEMCVPPNITETFDKNNYHTLQIQSEYVESPESLHINAATVLLQNAEQLRWLCTELCKPCIRRACVAS